ncbi:zinc finger protein interacting with ribonucleoprotein K-like [Sitodiplosis mosellana]|uniref:zinc finger protein interacting with ribonucleoprotein K-like n=1 Tax=Sitodiplosis mosellana TaxID=263140 RepID=UPI002444E6E7|nr:zinc finger protein interacting with ribonucleoprotein K-like [Sitodiplosis mosellana]
MEIETIAEWDAICRICLQEGQLHSLFDFDDEKSELNIGEKIMLCAPIVITTDGKLPEQICTECLYDLDVAFRFRKNCERSDTILQRFLNPTEDTELGEEYIEQSNDPLSSSRASKDSRVLVSSDAGLYEYRPPVGLNVKLVKSETGGRVLRTATKKSSSITASDEHTIYLKSEPMDDDTLDDSDNIDVLYDIETNFEDSTDAADKPIDSMRKVSGKSSSDASTTNENDPKIMQIKPVRTNKVRLGFTSANKTKASGSVSVKSKATSSENGSKENTATVRSPKSKTNAKGEPKQPKKCEICGNTYMYQHALESHMRRHRNEKPFVCSVCGKGFVINFELSRHMRTHTGQKPYACKYCDRRFSDFGSRVKHERIHTGERPYACNICGKTFAYSHVLSSHNLIHTGEKKYHCEVCGKRFAKSHHLKAHMNTHNKNGAKNQQQSQQHSQQQHEDQSQTQQIYALQVIDDQSQIDADSANEGDLAEYLTQANIITKDDDGTNSEGEGQLLLYDVDVLEAIKETSNIKKKYITTTKGGQFQEITIADHQDPIELLTFEDDELE